MGLLIKLQNGDTALKSLKFGKDRPGGGDSGQPYIKNPILDNIVPESEDFLLRGGLNAPLDAAQDVARLTKYMFDLKSPSGLLFTAKQNLLSRVAPKTEASKGIGYAGGALNSGVYTPLSTLAQAGVGFAGIHLNKQGLDPTGLIDALSIKKYEEVIKSQDENRLVTLTDLLERNRAKTNFNFVKGYTLNQGQDIITYDGGPGSTLGIGKTHIRYADQRTGKYNSLASSNPQYFYKGGFPRPKTLVNYNNLLGTSKKENLTILETGISENGTSNILYGPDTTYSTLSKNSLGLTLSGSNGYQIGNYLKHQTQQSETTYKSQIQQKLKFFGRELLSDSTFLTGNTWRATSQYTNTIPEYNSSPSLAIDPDAVFPGANNAEISFIFNDNNEGYLANLNKNSGPYIDPTTGEYTFTHNPPREGGRGIAGDFRLTSRKKRGFTDYPESYDYITTSSDYENITTVDNIYYTSADKRTSNSIESPTDLIKFRIGIIDPRNPTNDPKTLNFRAYIDNFSDSYNSDWKSQTYMGRAEKFYKYDSFDRSLSLGFTIVADSEANLNRMYSQLNTLAASLAPTYTKYGYMTGNLHKLTVGNYVSGQVGIMSGLTYEITDESPWEIKEGSQLPLYIKVTGIKFTPIHNFRPESQFNQVHSYINQ